MNILPDALRPVDTLPNTASRDNLCEYDQRALVRLIAKIEVQSPGCWIWTKGRDGCGYGRMSYRGRTTTAHRVAYELLTGQSVPSSMHIDHLCRVPACVNPDHLEPVTAQVNLRRGYGMAGRNIRKTHCDRGHEFTPENTYKAPGKKHSRCCRTCMRITGRAYDRRRAAVAS